MIAYTIRRHPRLFLPLCAFSLKKARYINFLVAAFAAFAAFAVPAGAQFNFRAITDTVKISPLSTVRIDVVKNDSIPCSNHALYLVRVPATDKCILSVSGNNIIVARPSSKARGDTLSVEYAVTCNGVSRTAVLALIVSQYSMPANIIDPFTDCTTESKTNLNFTPALKYVAGATNIDKANFEYTIPNSPYLDGFASPLVGDLNGDGKPEIVAMGLDNANNWNGTGVAARGKYIFVYNGQTGAEILKYELPEVMYLRDNPRHSSVSKMAIADLDRDGLAEIVMASSSGKVYCFKTVCDASGWITGLVLNSKWPDPNTTRFKAPITANSNAEEEKRVYGAPVPYIVDLDADGKPEVIVYNKIYDGTNGNLLLTLQKLEDFANPNGSNMADYQQNKAYVGRQPLLMHNDKYAPCIGIADIDGDGLLDIAAGSKVYKMKKVGGALDYDIIHGPSSVSVKTGANYGSPKTVYLADGFTCVADIDMDGNLDVIVANVVASDGNDMTFILYVWDPTSNDRDKCKAAMLIYENGWEGYLSNPFVGDINGKLDSNTTPPKKMPELCFITGRLFTNGKSDRVRGVAMDNNNNTTTATPIVVHKDSEGADRLTHLVVNNATDRFADNANFNCIEYSRNNFPNADRYDVVSGYVFALTWQDDPMIERRLQMSWALEVLDRSQMTGVTMFDFDNDGAMDICYKDEASVRVISPSRQNYIRINAASGAANAIRFRQSNIKSYTGYEAPVIADVNMDGSADILTMNYNGLRPDNHNANNEWLSRSWIYVWEHAPGTDKWAPCPPIWNQAFYNPLYINEDLTVPALPQSMLTSYKDRNGDIVYPYNGHWIQQPITLDNEYYIPVDRHPDAVILDMKVEANKPTANTATVTLVVRNKGTSSLNAATPVSFFNGGDASTGGYDIDNPNTSYITQLELGEDIFPGKTVTRSYIINRPLGGVLVWARIMADNRVFPAAGYTDCNKADNHASGASCPAFTASVTANPTRICGTAGSTTLTIAHTNMNSGFTPTYQWYINSTPIPGATSKTFTTSQAGSYKCFVTESICRTYSSELTVVREEPVPANDAAVSTNGAPVRVPILKNDNIAGCVPVIPVIVSGPKRGQAVIVNDTLIYTPNPGFEGRDTVEYGLPAKAKVFLQSNYITTARDDAASVTGGFLAEIDVLANDFISASCSPTVRISTPPARGAAYMAGGKVHYTASNSYMGADSLTYELKCGAEVSYAKVRVNTVPRRVFHVKENGTGDGSSWAQAYGNLADPLLWADLQRKPGQAPASGPGMISSPTDTIREIWVAGGTFYPSRIVDGSSNPRSAAFVLVAGVKLYGGFPRNADDQTHVTPESRHTTLFDTTVLSANIGSPASSADNSRFVVLAHNIPDNGRTVMDGFTVSDCYSADVAPQNSSFLFEGNGAAMIRGMGAVYCLSASPVLANLKVTDNNGYFAGGMSFQQSRPVVYNTLVADNKSASTSSGTAGVYIEGCPSVALSNLTVGNNESAAASGCGGISITAAGTVAALSNTIIWNNKSAGAGNNLIVANSAAANVSHCLIEDCFNTSSQWNPNMGSNLGGNMNIDPKFVAPRDYRLDFRSPAVNTGENALFPFHLQAGVSVLRNACDVNGQLRLVDTRVDIGAFEHQGWTLPPTGRVFYVTRTGSGKMDGSTWEHAYPNLADPVQWAFLQHTGAVPVANPGDSINQIWVGEGVYIPGYSPSGSITSRGNAFTIPKGLSICGGFPAAPSSSSHPTLESRFAGGCKGTPCLASTVLSGDIAGDDSPADITLNKTDNAFHVVIAADIGASEAALLDGVTIADGYADGSVSSVVNVGQTQIHKASGGGVFGVNASMVLSNVTLRNNYAVLHGGGFYGDGGSYTFVGVDAAGNRATLGGGMAFDNGEARLLNTALTGNIADSLGGGFHVAAGRHNMTNATVSGNFARKGGGLSSVGTSLILVNNSIIWGNKAQDDITAGADSLNNVFLSSSDSIQYRASLIEGSRGGTSYGYWREHFGIDSSGNSPLANLDTDPMFALAVVPPSNGQPQSAGGDFTVTTGSEILGKGDKDLYRNFFTPPLPDMTGQFDLAGNPRVYNNKLDKGAYESPVVPVTTTSVMYVKEGGSGSRDGSSWDNAYDNLADPLLWAARQRAGNFGPVPAADTIRQIWVAAGTYRPRHRASRETMASLPITDRDKAFVLADSVKIFGGFPKNPDVNVHTTPESRFAPGCTDPSCLAPTILSGDLIGDDVLNRKSDNAYHVVVAAHDVPGAVLDGFIIEGGYADGNEDIIVDVVSVRRRNGGGIYCAASPSPDEAPVFRNLVIRNNYAVFGGGGVFMETTYPSFVASSIVGNEAKRGGGIYVSGTPAPSNTPVFASTTIAGNKANYGGGFFASTFTEVSFANSRITGNSADSVAGGVALANATIKLTNVTVAGNRSEKASGGISVRGGCTAEMKNSIVWGNVAVQGGGTPDLQLMSDFAFFSMIVPPTVTVTASLIGGSGGSAAWNPICGTDGGGNIDASPMFEAPLDPLSAQWKPSTGGDFRLKHCSPAVNAGRNALYNLPAGGFDLAGSYRISARTIDMGAYERRLATGLTNGIFYVKTACAGRGDGSSWDNACGGLADPLFWAALQRKGVFGHPVAPNDTIRQIWVAAGTYLPKHRVAEKDMNGADTDSRDRTFPLVGGVKVYGGFPSFASDLHYSTLASRGSGRGQLSPTILDGDLQGDDAAGARGDNVYHVVIGSGIPADQSTVLDGFIIRGGNADGSSVKVQVSGRGFSRESGGGIALMGASPVMKNLVVEDNRAAGDGGGMLLSELASPQLYVVDFTGNRSAGSGGGVAMDNSNAEFANVILAGNTAANGGGIASNNSPSPLFIDVLASGNSASANGGGALVRGTGRMTFTNVTVAGNYAAGSGGGIYTDFRSTPLFENCIVSRNAAAAFDNSSGTAEFAYSLVEGSGGSGANWLIAFGSDGGDNADADPMFAAPASPSPQGSVAGDYRLMNGSPALNSGETARYDNALLATALHNTATAAAARDLGGDPRLLDGKIDMGAYEKALSIKPANGVFFVKNAHSGLADGSSWSNAYGNLADPLLWAAQQRDGTLTNVASSDTIREIWVAEGVYKPMHYAVKEPDPRVKAFVLVNGVKIYGGFPDNADDMNHAYLDSRYAGNCRGNSCLAPTILSGDLKGDDIPFDFSQNRTDNVYHVVVAADIPDDGQTLIDGLILSGGHSSNSPSATSYTVNGKEVTRVKGGAIYNVDAGPVYANLLLTDNCAEEGGGAASWCDIPQSQVPGVSPLFRGSTFAGNMTMRRGGAVSLFQDSTRMANCLFTGNFIARGEGGAIIADNSRARIMNSTIAGNYSGGSGGGLGVYNAASRPEITNSIIYGNDAAAGAKNIDNRDNADIRYSFSHIEDCFTVPGMSGTWDASLGVNGFNNIDANPLFVAPVAPSAVAHASGNYRLQSGSSAMNTADSILYVNFFAPPLATVQQEWDADGLPRFVAPALDRGAYQAPPSLPQTFPVMYVKENGSGAGSSWADAYPNLADPLLWANMQRNGMAGVVAQADTIREIWVAEGVYVPLYKPATRDNSGNVTNYRHKTFLLADGVKVYGGFPVNADDTNHDAVSKRPSPLAPTVLSGALGGSDSVNHVLLAAGLKPWHGAAALLDGFTVSGGNADDMGTSYIKVNGIDIDGATGGGLIAFNSEMNLKNMTFAGNKAYKSGGAIHTRNGVFNLSGSSVTGNAAGLLGGYGGGGIYAVNSAVTFDRVSLNLNVAGAGGIYGGGGMLGTGGSFLITASEIRGNTATATSGGGLLLSAPATFIDVLIAGNSAAKRGGAILASAGAIKMTNVTVSGNRTLAGATLAFGSSQGSIDFDNGILWGNMGAPFAYGGQSSVTFRYSLVETCGGSGSWSCASGSDGGNNLAGDPLFSTWVDPSAPIWTPTVTGDYRLQTVSPAVNSGSSTLYMNAFSPPLSSLGGQTDLGGTPRLVGSSIDRGAYESAVSQMAMTDFAMTDARDSVRINVLLNDVMNPACNAASVTLGIVAASSPQNGSAYVDPATNTVVYKPAAGFDGLDQFMYYMKCNADSSAAQVYVAALKPVARSYFACDGATARLGMKSRDSYGGKVFSFDWYDDEFANAPANLLAADTAVIEDTKFGSPVQTYWVEARHNGFVFPRYRIELKISDECGGAPSACTTDGTLLFREDFGGNKTSDPVISPSGLASPATDYFYNPNDPNIFPQDDQYLLIKKFVGNKDQDSFTDHTSPAAPDRGYMMLVNARIDPKLIYSAEITGVCQGPSMHFSAWTGNLASRSRRPPPQLRFVLHDVTTGDCLAEYYTGGIAAGIWVIYGFTLPVESAGLRLSIYNDQFLNFRENDFVLDDVEMRVCLPSLTLNQPVNDTLDLCEGATTTLDASFTDDGTFGSDLKMRLEYNPTDNLNDPAEWTAVANTDAVSSTGAISASFPLKAAVSAIGHYRFAVADNSGGINSYYCRAMSRIFRLDVTEAYIPPDIRLNVTPATGSVNLSSHLDSIEFPHRIDWMPASAFTNVARGTIDVSGWTGSSAAHYHYDFSTPQCGVRRAKVYARTLSADYNKAVKVEICVGLARNRVLNLDQILGMRTAGGQWNLLNDPNSIFRNNLVQLASGTYAGARMFNASLAFAQSLGNPAYNYNGDPNKRKFEFEYVDAAHQIRKTVTLVLYN